MCAPPPSAEDDCHVRGGQLLVPARPWAAEGGMPGGGGGFPGGVPGGATVVEDDTASGIEEVD